MIDGIVKALHHVCRAYGWNPRLAIKSDIGSERGMYIGLNITQAAAAAFRIWKERI